MITTHIDLGQLILAGMIGVIGYLIKRMVDRVDQRLDKHDALLMGLIKDVAHLIGIVGRRRSNHLEESRD